MHSWRQKLRRRRSRLRRLADTGGVPFDIHHVVRKGKGKDTRAKTPPVPRCSWRCCGIGELNTSSAGEPPRLVARGCLQERGRARWLPRSQCWMQPHQWRRDGICDLQRWSECLGIVAEGLNGCMTQILLHNLQHRERILLDHEVSPQ